MRFTQILRDKHTEYDDIDYSTIAWDQSRLLKEKLDESIKSAEALPKPQNELTWKKLTAHSTTTPNKEIKAVFDRFLSKIEALFMDENVSILAYNFFKSILRNDQRSNFEERAKRHLKITQPEFNSLRGDAQRIFDWHISTGGTIYKFQKTKNSPEKKSEDFGVDVAYCDPFDLVHKEQSEKEDFVNKKEKSPTKFSSEWLYSVCAGLSSPLESASRIVEEIHSAKTDSQIQDSLFQILGERRVEQICEIITNRKIIKQKTKSFSQSQGTVNTHKRASLDDLHTDFSAMQLQGIVSDRPVLPEGTKHLTFSNQYEEFEIPAKQKATAKGRLVELSEINEEVRCAFGDIKRLNALQSQCFDTAFHTSENLLVCAPTGAGKTNVALLAIVRQALVNMKELEKFKVVYVTPMKALAREITEKFKRKLRPLGLSCAEFTGDMQLTRKQISSIDLIVTTPEKWDVVTRKESQVAKEVRLFIIDEIHLLNEDRGPVLESIVARTKMLVEKSQTPIRMVGLSATLPNYQDVATFMRVNEKGLFYFGEEHRPVPLAYNFLGVSSSMGYFKKSVLMQRLCYEKALEALRMNKQVIVFVHSRKETTRTALSLLDAFKRDSMMQLILPEKKLFEKNRRAYDNNLNNLFASGIAVHNAGIVRHDRTLVEKLFLKGSVRVLVSTATLAWGVNLPAHTVIIKGTSLYSPTKGKFVNLGGLDVMQIFGRAGRPQFDDNGKAILITEKKLLNNYIRLLTTQIPIESKFVESLENNLNAEVVSGTISNLGDAVNWLAYTYLFIRMLRNPLAYGVPYEEVEIDQTLLSRREQVVKVAASRLVQNRILRFEKGETFYPTSLGRIASHFYIHYESINLFIEEINRKRDFMSIEDTFEMISKAKEFEQIQVRNEELSELCDIELPLKRKKDIDDKLFKVSMLIQAYICRIKVKTFTLTSDIYYVSQNIGRIARALFEICLNEKIPALTRHFLNFSKMVQNRVWKDEHPLAQFGGLSREIVSKLAKRKISLSSIIDEEIEILGRLISNRRKAFEVKRLAKCLPKVDINVVAKPITRSILKVTALITPDFVWDNSLHGSSQSFWLWLEDSGADPYIHFKEFVSIDKKAYYSGEEIKLEFMVSIPTENFTSQFILVSSSDNWLGTEQNHPIPFDHLVLPKGSDGETNLFDLKLIPVESLHNAKFQSFYSFKHFNRIQTQVFHVAFHTDKNILLGAPTGSGKTVIAELAVFRIINKNTKLKTVYIAPLKALAREKHREWTQKFGRVGVRIAMLTGDETPEPEELQKAQILITTPEKWDGVSRHWKNRGYVRSVALLLIDEIHLLGTDRGGALEAIISRTRYISEQTKQPIRILGLSTALANAGDLAEWLGINRIGLYNFPNRLRSVPLEIHVAGYPGRHYCPRMNAMNKPCYQALLTHASGKPSIVFVSSRRQTRLTAFDLINFLSLRGGNPQRWMRLDYAELPALLSRIKDENLRKTLEFGIGIHHAGLSLSDRRIVEELFSANLVQVLICTATLAWGVNLPAHLVVVKGTEFYDAKTRRYIDMPLTDVLQMVGRAGRPGFDERGVACLLVHEQKKSFFLKFLHQPFPLESTFHTQLHNHLNAEIATGTVVDKESVLDYLEWTFFARRIKNNPSFYGISAEEGGNVELMISARKKNLIYETLNDLRDAGCIAISSEGGLAPSPLGKICSLYYIDYKTVSLFQRKLLNSPDPEEILRILSTAYEFEELPTRHNEDSANEELSQKLTASCAGMDFGSPFTKTFILFQCHLQRVQMPICDYETDLRSVIDQSVRLLQALVDVAISKGFFAAITATINLLQHLVQARWFDESALLNVPGVDAHVCRILEEKGVRVLPEFCKLGKAGRRRILAPFRFPQRKLEKMESFLKTLPYDVNITFSFRKRGEDNLVEGEINLSDRTPGVKVQSKRWTKPRKNSWFVLIGDSEDRILFFKRVGACKRRTIRSKFEVYGDKGVTECRLLLMSDSFVEFDQIYHFCV